MDSVAEELIPTRTTLLLRLKDWRDQSGWQDFFDTYWNLIYGVAIKGGLTPAEAEDVVQETMISVAKNMPGFKYDPAIGSFKGWLLKMTRWRMADQFRKRGPQNFQIDGPELGEGVLEQGTDAPGPELEKMWDEEWEDNLLKAAMAKARRRLDPKQYQIFDFYVNKNWAPEKIAKTFGVPVGQVYLAKHRVTDLVKQEVERLKKELI
jgi:RNA polymerase sigma-70 factor (ECF subfamily)